MSGIPEKFIGDVRSVLLLIIRMFLVATAFLYFSQNPSWSQVQLLPNELMDVAAENNCSQVDDFYKRPGMVNPSFFYGYLDGEKESSAIFWCRNMNDREIPYRLVIVDKIPGSGRNDCPQVIEWRNYPGGLSVYNNPNLTLEGFRFHKDLTKNPPAGARMEHNAIIEDYDGTSTIFYCFEGDWVFMMRD